MSESLEFSAEKTLTVDDYVLGFSGSPQEPTNAGSAKIQQIINLLKPNIEAEKTRAEGAENTLQGNITAESDRAKNAENTLQANITAEADRAKNAENTLQANITAEATRASGSEETINASIIAEANRAATAENTLQANIAAEATRASEAEGTIQTNITTETTRASEAEETLATDIASEVSRATAAEGAINADIANRYTKTESDDKYPLKGIVDVPGETSTASVDKPAYVIENGVLNGWWWRVWSDGWKEQGNVSLSIPAEGTTVFLPIGYSFLYSAVLTRITASNTNVQSNPFIGKITPNPPEVLYKEMFISVCSSATEIVNLYCCGY